MILASGSATRAALLRAAGVPIEVAPFPIDEASTRAACRAEGLSTDETAMTLAHMKAARAADHHPERLILAADQMLECEGHWFEKPAGIAEARAQLLALKGRRHSLHSAIILLEGGNSIWSLTQRADLWMRDFSGRFLEAYLAAAGDDLKNSVGAYRLEGLGAQLFHRIEGDYFAILGLPLLPLLAFLRDRGILLP